MRRFSGKAKKGKIYAFIITGAAWTLLSLFGKLIYASETTWFEDKMATCFQEVSDEESAVKWTRKLPARFFSPFSATPEDKVYIQGQI